MVRGMNDTPGRILFFAAIRQFFIGRYAAACFAVTMLAAAFVCLAGCENYPRDPEQSLAHVRERGVVVVGVAEARPWVIRGDGTEPGGVEADLVRKFADSVGAKVEWRWGSLDDHLEALEKYELQIVIGGINKASPWRKHVGLTRPFYDEQYAVGFASENTATDALDDLRVHVRRGEGLLAKLREKDAEPVAVDDLWSAQPPVAAPKWELDARGLTPGRSTLRKVHHVMAVPPGENGLLMALDQTLLREKGKVRQQLVAYGRLEAGK